MIKTGKRILITGQSGIKINETLKNFCLNNLHFVRGDRPSPDLYNVEKIMERLYADSGEKLDSEMLWIEKILSLPIPQLYILWESAFKEILSKIEKAPERDVIVSFHACFYHHYTIEYLSFVNSIFLLQFKPDIFITFIDDIYDIHSRLRAPNQIFNPALAGAQDSEHIIREMRRILDWRAREIMMSRHLANEINKTPHFCFAVKHPDETFYQLLFENKAPFYFSHPISEVRRLHRSGHEEKANNIIETIHRLEERASHEFVCFLPTTIDEYRIEFNPDNKKYSPSLTKRWDEEKYANPNGLLYIKPDKVVDNVFYIPGQKSHSGDHAGDLKNLAEHIEIQISSRDHKLVEQSECLFVYRPCFNGNVSRGVLKEIKYYLLLIDSLKMPKKCFIYLPHEDQNILKINQLQLHLNNAVRQGKVKDHLKRTDDIFLNPNEIDQWISNDENPKQCKTLLRKIITDRGLSVKLERHGLESDSSQEAMQYLNELFIDYKRSVDRFITEYRQAATKIWEEDNLSPETLINNVIQEIKKERKQ